MTESRVAARLFVGTSVRLPVKSDDIYVNMDRIKLESYAKVNLTLEVSDKRPDGFHDIDSVVQVIDITDEIYIERADAEVIELDVDVEHVPSDKDNIIYKACKAFFCKSGINGGARVRLVKRIPVQAGLGGGSGNAATVIAGLNLIYECGYSAEELAEIAATVGSDSPLFIYGGTVRMRGRGEIVDPLPDAPGLWMVIIKPDVGVSTAWAYGELDKKVDRETRAASNCAARSVRAGFRSGLLACMWNDFDPVVCGAFDEIRHAKDMLLSLGAEAALLAGSGSAVFGVFPDQPSAQKAADTVKNRFREVFVTRSLGRTESSVVGQYE